MIANGFILPFIALQMYWHSLIWVASLWAITFRRRHVHNRIVDTGAADCLTF